MEVAKLGEREPPPPEVTSEQLWTREVVFSTSGTVNSENTNRISNQIFVLRAILLKREKGIVEAKWTHLGLDKAPGFLQ